MRPRRERSHQPAFATIVRYSSLMRSIDWLVRHLSVGVAGFLLATSSLWARQGADIAGSATFYVLVAGTRVGTETSTLSPRGTGWLLSSVGLLSPPLDLVTNTFEVAY